jgi:hypothetical protein
MTVGTGHSGFSVNIKRRFFTNLLSASLPKFAEFF